MTRTTPQCRQPGAPTLRASAWPCQRLRPEAGQDVRAVKLHNRLLANQPLRRLALPERMNVLRILRRDTVPVARTLASGARWADRMTTMR